MTDYEKHIEFLASVATPHDLSEDIINEQFRLLLSILPNNGKLYKYRSLVGNSFENTYNSLEKGYMWIGKASELNDDADSLFVGDPIQAVYKAVDYLYADKARLIYTLFKKCGTQMFQSCDELKNLPLEEMFRCFDATTKELDEKKAVQLLLTYCGGDTSLAINYTQYIREIVVKILDELHMMLHQSIDNFCNFNHRMRQELHVFSMSESYDLSNLWAYYADAGKGFCIEYDYRRAEGFDSDLKWKLLNTQKIEYSDAPFELDFGCLLEKAFFDNDSVTSMLPFTKSVMKQALRKEICWEHEREWRITLGNTPDMVPIDIVSGIIIDERSIHSANAQRLIRLCADRKWGVKVRRCNVFQTAHSYEDYIISEVNQ